LSGYDVGPDRPGEHQGPEISTRRGDDGRSDLFSGERRSKADPVFEALGDLDELNSCFGLVRRAVGQMGAAGDTVLAQIDRAQSAVMAVASVVATTPESSETSRAPGVTTEDIAALEYAEDELKNRVNIEPSFVKPGERGGVPELDVARALTRRCERRVVAVLEERGGSEERLLAAQRYLNRLADYLFIAARFAEAEQ
jgi:cob(I)alamin adenosyltransferase